ncbi:hypothetical protein GCM10011505_28890 [Tistrella bauzanensis]|uniref:Uncharacterized protein n=2 Tax=Tistrella bauzanensis TaxID=657419 RepID=A0ABQ1IKW6_9PROT|nr:hypothetical protein GCM10011505_28890 [Tistrella bauzanensis]
MAETGMKTRIKAVWSQLDLIDRQLVKVAAAVLVILILRNHLPPTIDMAPAGWLLALALLLARPAANLIRRGRRGAGPRQGHDGPE